jgi:hypothetical protein
MKYQIIFFCLASTISMTHYSTAQCGNSTVAACSPSVSQGSSGTSVFTPASSTQQSISISTLTFPPLAVCEVNAYDNELSRYTNISSSGCPTANYNCHGYAWHKSFYGQANYGKPQEVWIQSEEVPKYWSDNSFYEVFSPPVNVKGVILYYSQGAITHSAVNDVGSSPLMYISKWGAGHLVRHSPTNVPTNYGSPSRFFLFCGACDAAPDLSKLTYNLGAVKNTVNFVAAGGYTMYTNLNRTCGLNTDMTWTGNGNNWAATGFGKLTVLFNISSGQSVTFTGNAANNCGSSSRTVTFVAQSSYRIASTAQVRDNLSIEFDNTDYLEILPQEIIISDEKNGKEELRVSVKELFERKYFQNNKQLSIDVKKVTRGMKIVNFIYNKLDTKEAQDKVAKGDFSEKSRKTERILLVD